MSQCRGAECPSVGPDCPDRERMIVSRSTPLQGRPEAADDESSCAFPQTGSAGGAASPKGSLCELWEVDAQIKDRCLPNARTGERLRHEAPGWRTSGCPWGARGFPNCSSGTWAVHRAILKRTPAYPPSGTPGATLHPSQRSPCYVVQDSIVRPRTGCDRVHRC
jgi:hypothetical protein